MNVKSLVTVLLCLVGLALAADQLQIGVTKKIPASRCERKTRKSDVISVHYTGKLEDGTVFDSSVTRGTPIEFPLGAGRVIKGWDQGLMGMCIGEKRKLVIPPELAYGKSGAGGVIPPDATLFFETELVAIKGYTPPEYDEEEEVDEKAALKSEDEIADAAAKVDL